MKLVKFIIKATMTKAVINQLEFKDTACLILGCVSMRLHKLSHVDFNV